jgi:hypothetical protein
VTDSCNDKSLEKEELLAEQARLMGVLGGLSQSVSTKGGARQHSEGIPSDGFETGVLLEERLNQVSQRLNDRA